MPARLRLVALLAALAVALFVFTWSRIHPRVVARTTPQAVAAVVDREPRLAPDARALIAIADLERLVTGAPRAPVAAAWTGDGWAVTCGGRAVGTLSTTPDYPELRALLLRWLDRLGADSAFAAVDGAGARPAAATRAVDAAIRRDLDGLRALAALQTIDGEWAAGRRDPRLVLAAARAAALLQVEAVDNVGASDTLAGRALALAALAARADSAGAARVECLVAGELGYGAAACAIADRLPERDVVRWFVRRSRDRVAALAQSARTPEARFLRLVDRARAGDLDSWAPLADRENGVLPTLPILSSGLVLGRFEASTAVGSGLLGAVAADMRITLPSRADGGRHTLGELIDEFERLMEGMPAASDGPVLDRAIVRSYYRSAFYSGLRVIGDHLLHGLSSAPAARELAEGMAVSRSGAGGEFERWFAHLAAAKAGEAVIDSLVQDLFHMPHFGAALRFETYDALDRLAIMRSREHPSLTVRTLIARMDTRPDHLERAAILVSEVLWDPVRAEQMDSLLAVRIHPAATDWWIWWSSYNGDADRLLAIAVDPGQQLRRRVTALGVLDRAGLGDTALVRAANERLVAEYPAQFLAVWRWADHLDLQGRRSEARRVLEDWLARPDRSDGAFEEINARTRLARLYQQDGRIQEGLASVGPAAESWQYGALERAALLLDDAGRPGAADSLAVAAWQRYPDSRDAQALVVRLLWRHREDAMAASALGACGGLCDSGLVRERLVPVVIERFAGAPSRLGPVVDAAAAAAPHNVQALRVLAEELSLAGNDRLAFETASRLRSQEGDETEQMMLSAYGYLSRCEGPAAARAWYRERTRGMDPAMVEKVLTLAFGEGQSSLLWDAEWPRRPDEHLEFLWLLRAAAVVRGDVKLSEARRRELDRHFASRGDSHYRILGRYLLGSEDLATALAASDTPRATSEAYFYVGLKAQAAGDVREAARWYARCAALRQRANGEDWWARAQVSEWVSRGISLERIAAGTRAKAARPRPTGGTPS